jgi:hypothetical protein
MGRRSSTSRRSPTPSSYRIDPASGNVIATIEVGGRPDDVAVGEGGVWVMVRPA